VTTEPQVADAIVIQDVTKHFRKSTIQRYHTTFKTELIRWIRGQHRPPQHNFIQSLNGVTLRIPRGATMGIIGRNGAGKSTLLKIITGIYTPTSGSVDVHGRVSALLDLGAGFHPEFSGRENILINGIILGMSRSEIRRRMQTIIDFSELGEFIDEPVRTYSSGMYMRLAFSVATHVDPDILLIDEILAVGDEHFSRKSRAKMSEFKKGGRTIVLVTHDLNTVQTWCDQAVWIDAGLIRAVGTPSEVVKQYRDAVALAEGQTTPEAIAAQQIGAALPANASARVLSAGGAEQPAPLVIERLRLTNQFDQEVSVVGPSNSLDIAFDFSTTRNVDKAVFAITITRADGQTIYSTDTAAEAIALPRPLPRFGNICLRLEELNLGDGNYSVEVTARPEGMTRPERRASSFAIRSGLPDTGLMRIPHRWIVESHEQQTLVQVRSAAGS
jgi:lipopolysaccharide transport system ATP-binding protein